MNSGMDRALTRRQKLGLGRSKPRAIFEMNSTVGLPVAKSVLVSGGGRTFILAGSWISL
jgi:hypothetical protein